MASVQDIYIDGDKMHTAAVKFYDEHVHSSGADPNGAIELIETILEHAEQLLTDYKALAKALSHRA
jgi:hypothetical protein